MTESKFCPFISVAGQSPVFCQGKHCALAINRWDPNGEQETCSQDICALAMIAFALANHYGEDVSV